MGDGGGQLCGVQRVGGPGLWGRRDQSSPHQVIYNGRQQLPPSERWSVFLLPHFREGDPAPWLKHKLPTQARCLSRMGAGSHVTLTWHGEHPVYFKKPSDRPPPISIKSNQRRLQGRWAMLTAQ